MDRRKLLLIDTGPLRELITFMAVFGLGFQSLQNEIEFLFENLLFERFGHYIGSFQQKSTTSSVIVELYHWIRETNRSGRKQIWSLVYDEFARMGMEERSVKLLDMPMDMVARCGPADISLLTLAHQQVDSDPVVLTMDRELRSECLNAKIRVVHIHDILGRPNII
jgi:rRNA-processing protein FCF1